MNPGFSGKSGDLGVVLITRPEPGATETAARVSALGLLPLIAPVLSIANVAKPIKRLRQIQATLLTSRNALVARFDDFHLMPAFAVGDATAERAKTSGFKNVTTASGDAAALAELVTRTLEPARGSLYLPTGHRQGFDLTNSLRHGGYRIVRHVVYDARPVLALPSDADIQLRRNGVRSVMFFSAETAGHFVRLVSMAGLERTLSNVEAVTISERATVPLRHLTWRCIRVAAKPNQDSMLTLLQ